MTTTDEGGDPRDPVFDVLLREALAERRTTDLAEKVRARLQGVGPGLVSLPRQRGRVLAAFGGTLLGAAAAAAALLAFGAGRADLRFPAPPVAWHVVDGCVAWRSKAEVRTARAGERALWPVATGDRLRNCGDGAAVCDVASLGRLRMTKGTEIEVAAMQWKTFGSGVALGAVTVAVVSGVIQWSGGGDTARAHSGESLELRAEAPNVAAARVEALQREVEALQQQLAREQARARDLEATAACTVATNAEQVAAAEQAAEQTAAPKLKHAVTWAGMESVLDSIDWDVTGKCMHEMTRKLDAVLAAIENGEELPLALLGEVAKLNAELIQQAAALMEADVPGTGPNGVFTNPIVAANQVHATLEKAGAPLTAQQREALQRLGAQIAGEDEARLAKVGEDAFQLETILGETELKDRFYAEARNLLTEEQRAILFPPRFAGTRANLFDSGLVWAQFAKPLPVRDRAELADRMVEAIRSQAGIGADLAPQLRAAVSAWVEGLPDDAIGTTDQLDRIGMGKVGPVRAHAERQLALMQRIASTLPLTAEQKKRLRKGAGVFVPVRSE